MADLITAPAVQYADAHTSPFSGALAQAVAWTTGNTSSPGMMAGLPEARLLELLIVASGARHVLEIGTFTGIGALAMAAALPQDGRVTTLEIDPDNAAIAQRHFDSSPHGDRIELIVGSALDTLATLPGPFDLVWIDAWKNDYPAYFDAVIDKLSPRGVIAADNLFRAGDALDAGASDPGTIGIREFADRVQADPRVHNVLLSIGDGVMLAWHAPGR
jgi:predicted O-methyltransferase YrrM